MIYSLLFSLLLLFSVPSSPESTDMQRLTNQTPIEIPIGEDGQYGNPPRQSAEIPIRAYYLAGTVIVSFLQDLGDVEITIDEESNGTILQTIVDSSTLSAILPLNMSSGEFSIFIVLSSGVEYHGQFSI